jgi:pyruvate dehydrogenase E2 component (dihydrolipoamide acetyltransferase)
MPTEVILPRVDMDMTEGKIAVWHVRNGDVVTKGQALFDIETDKATMEVESPAAGVVDGIGEDVGIVLPVGRVVAWILAKGEAREAPAPRELATTSATALSATAPSITAPSVTAPPSGAALAAGAQPGAKLLRATPLARSLARSHGVELEALRGSGPLGRIQARDVPVPSTRDRADGIHLHWWHAVRPAPLVMLHGFGADHASWRPLLQRLPGGVPVLGLDLPNHGHSPLRPPASIHDLARTIGRRLEEEGVGEFHLVGHSLGGGVAIALAAASPRRVKTLSLLAPAGLGPEIDASFFTDFLAVTSIDALRPVLARLVRNPDLLTTSFVTTAFQVLKSDERRAALAEMAAGMLVDGHQKESLRGALEALRMPIKVFWGDGDRIVPPAHAAALPARVGLHWLAGVGHLPHVEAPELVAELLRQQPGLSGDAPLVATGGIAA